MKSTKAAKKGKEPCQWCGKYCAPGPMKQHLKACDRNPHKVPFHVTQPTGNCRWCGMETTLGALGTHEAYGCSKRPSDGGDARRTCQYCGEVTTLPPALISHERICPQNPATPQRIPIRL
jgi:hypothetical protein